MFTTISHVALVVRDPARTVALFEAIFGVAPVPPKQQGKGPPETIMSIGGIWFVLVKGEPSAVRTDDHIAFTVPESTFSALADWLADLGIESQLARSGTAGSSLYFVDYDNHLFELHTGQFERELVKER